MDKPKAAADKSRFLTSEVCKDRFRHAGCIHICFWCVVIMGVLSTTFETFVPFFHMLYFQRTMKLYLYQLAVSCDGEKMIIPI